MEKDQFIFALSQDCIVDIAKIDAKTWARICKTVKHLMETRQCDNVGKAYICAFLVYLQELEMLVPPYDPKKDLSM